MNIYSWFLAGMAVSASVLNANWVRFCMVVFGKQSADSLDMLLQRNDLEIRQVDKNLGSFCKIRVFRTRMARSVSLTINGMVSSKPKTMGIGGVGCDDDVTGPLVLIVTKLA